MAVLTTVLCDRCGANISWVHTGTVRTRKWAREEGWTTGKQDLCPNCRRKKKVLTN